MSIALPMLAPTGQARLIVNAEHFRTIVLQGICGAKTSVDIMTADFKAMLVPDGYSRRARSIVEIFRVLANKGVEVRLLHAGVPSGPALRSLSESCRPASPSAAVRDCIQKQC